MMKYYQVISDRQTIKEKNMDRHRNDWNRLSRIAFGVVTILLLNVNIATTQRNNPPVKTISSTPSNTTSLVFDGVTVVDVEQGRLIPQQRIVIVGNRIQSVGSTSEVKVPKTARIINAQGKYVIPGLWDMHTHRMRPNAEFALQLFIANGVTGVRDAASEWSLDSMVKWRNEVLAGTRVGPPRQILSGHAINYFSDCEQRTTLHICFADSSGAVHVIDSLISAGADMLKTYSLSPRMYFILAAKARSMRIRFGGHTASVSAIEASDSGAKLIDHFSINAQLKESCLSHKATIEKCHPIAEKFVHNGTWWVPTWWVSLPRIMGQGRSPTVYKYFGQFVHDFVMDSISPSHKQLHEYLHRGFAEAILSSAQTHIDPKDRAPSESSTVDSLGYMYVVRRAGLPVVAGTDCGGRDLIPGFSLHAELAAYVAEGMTPLEALQTATLNPAKFLGATDSLGTISSGKLADLILLDADPLTEIINTTRIRAVVANGRYYDRTTLDSILVDSRVKAKKAGFGVAK